MKPEKTSKKMTVSYKPGSTHLGMIPVPSIRITNNLLKECGFNYRDKVMVEYEAEKITVYTLKRFESKL